MFQEPTYDIEAAVEALRDASRPIVIRPPKPDPNAVLCTPSANATPVRSFYPSPLIDRQFRPPKSLTPIHPQPVKPPTMRPGPQPSVSPSTDVTASTTSNRTKASRFRAAFLHWRSRPQDSATTPTSNSASPKPFSTNPDHGTPHPPSAAKPPRPQTARPIVPPLNPFTPTAQTPTSHNHFTPSPPSSTPFSQNAHIPLSFSAVKTPGAAPLNLVDSLASPSPPKESEPATSANVTSFFRARSAHLSSPMFKQNPKPIVCDTVGTPEIRTNPLASSPEEAESIPHGIEMENILEIPFNCVFGFDASLEFNFGYRANRVAIPYSVRLCADLTEGDIVPVSAALERDDDVPCSMHIKLVSPEVPFVPYADAENYLEALLVFWAAPDTFIESGSARYLLTVTDEAGQQHETSIQLQITGTDPVISVQTRTSEPDVDSKETSIEFEPGKSFAEETVIIKNHTYGGAPLLIHVVVSDGAGGVFSLGLNSEQVDECISKKVASGRSFSFTARFKLLPEITMLGAYYGCALIKFALALPKEGFLGHDTELHQFYDHVLSFQACMIANESASHEVIPCPSLSAHEDEDLTGHDSFCSQEDEHPEEVCLGYALGLRSGNEPESCGKNDGCYEPQEGDGDLEISSQLQKEGDGGCDLIPHISEPMSSLPVLIDERVLEPMPENLENLPYMVCNVSIDQPPTWIQSGRHARDGSEYDGEAQESVEEHSDLDRLCSAEKPQLVEEVSKPAMTTKDGREANNLEEWNKQATNSEKHVREALSSFHHNSAHEEIPTDLNQPAGMQVGSRVELETDVEPGEIVEGASVPPGGPGRSSTASERVRDIVEYLRACESDSTPSEHEDTSDLKPTSRNNESGNESILKPKEGPFESAATSSDARTSSVAPVTTGHPEESIASSGKYSPGALPEDERRVARKFFNPKTNFTPKVSLGENSQSISENAGGKPVESYDSVQDLVADDSRIGKSIRKVFKKDFKPKLKMPPWIRDGGIRIPADSGTIRLPILSASPSMIEVSVSVKSLSRQRNPATVNPNFFVLNTNQTTKISISRTSAAEGKLLLIMQCSPAKGPRLRRTYEVPLFIEQSFVHVPAAQGFAVDRPALTFYNPDESSQNCRVRVLNGTSTPTQYKLWIGNARKGQRAAFKVQSTKRGFIEPQECVGIQVAYRGSKDVEYHRDKLYIKVGDSMDILPLFGYTGYSDVRFSVTLHGRIRARNYGTRYGFVALSGPEVDSPENELIKTVLGPEQACEFEPPYGTGTLIYTGDEIARSRMCYAHELMKPPTESRGSPDVECMFAGEFEGEEQAQCDEQLVWDKDTKHSLHYAGRLLDSNVKRYGFDVDTERIVLLPDAGRGQDSKWHASVDESGIVHIENYDSKEELSFAVQGAEPRFGTVPALGDAVVAAFAENICIKARGRTLELEIPKAS